MTLQEAIMDKSRPLSVTPQEWMQYEEAKDHEEEELFDRAADRIIRESSDSPDDEGGGPDADERFEAGVEQMILGCRIAIRALQELSRSDLKPGDRSYYDECERLVCRAVAPYLADILVARKRRFSRKLDEMNESRGGKEMKKGVKR